MNTLIVVNTKGNIMRKLATIIAFVLTYGALVAQDVTNTQLTIDHVNQFFKTKTYVVLDDNPLSDYNAKIETVVKKYWNLTPYEMIDQKTFQLKRTDPNCSFLILSEVVFTEDILVAKYDFFSVLLGGKYPVMNQMPVLAAVPIGYSEAPQESSMYKLGALVKFVMAHINRLKEHPELVKMDMYKLYNKDQKTIKDKTLYLVKDEMDEDLNSEAEIKAIYPDKFKFVSRDELEEAIDKNEPNVVFLHKVGPEGYKKKARCYILIVGTDSKLYYFNWHMINEKKPDSMLESDFKNILKFKKE